MAPATRGHILAVPVMSSVPTISCWAARTRSEVSITTCRGSRSAQTPPPREKATRLRGPTARPRPTRVALPPIRKTAKASAIPMRPSPIAEVAWPAHSNRKRGSDKASRLEGRRNGVSLDGGPGGGEWLLGEVEAVGHIVGRLVAGVDRGQTEGLLAKLHQADV